jgi:pyruvate dehydrogenase E1 component alpha subunit
MCRAAQFGEQCEKAIRDERVKCFAYLSNGQESIGAAVAEAFRDVKVNVFPQHRNQAEYIAFGGDVTKLRDELLGLPTGTTGGIGGDPMHAFESQQVKFIGHVGLVGDNIPIAVGHAYASKDWSICFIGDSSVEEDTFGPSIGFATTHNVPVLFVEADNGLSVITETSKRRSWRSASIADAYGCATYRCEDDEPFSLCDAVKNLTKRRIPVFISVATNRKYRHVGTGLNDTPMRWDTMMETRIKLLTSSNGFTKEADIIEGDAISEMEALWK